MEIDLKIVATRRPDLLEATLQSFRFVGLRDFQVSSISMNLDPAFGTVEDAEICNRLIQRYFPGALVHEPLSPSFGGAVKRLWSEAGELPIFHLEDDWIAREPLSVDFVQNAFDQGYGAVTPLAKEHSWDSRNPEALTVEIRRFFGLRVGKRATTRHSFGTSPKFILGALARRLAAKMDPDRDPEKKMYSGELDEVVQSFRSVFMTMAGKKPIIEDIGRDWRKKRGIKKQLVEGKSVWLQEDQTDQ